VNSIILLLGSNEGDRCGYLASAKKQLNSRCGNIVKESAIYETAAWGKTDQSAFLNQAIVLETELDPFELLRSTRSIELDCGRERTVRWGSRTLDIDILFFNDEIIQTAELQVPHPGIPDRRFALVPLNDIACNKIHPVLQRSMEELLKVCPDHLEVCEYSCGMMA
jgi:2-amino-4-hydroxy-6-hydroxymethyldihydropteridine diphosphokinase